MDFREKLMNVQRELKAPKNLYNSFSNFYYRNCESIFEAVKPLLTKYELVLIMNDRVELIGDRIYMVAKAELHDIKTNDFVTAEAWARESESKKGMTTEQISGSASSYARKYCLNGLFLLDDTRDPDCDEEQTFYESDSKKTKSVNASKVTATDVKALKSTLEANGIPVEFVVAAYKVRKLEDLTFAQFNNLRLDDSIKKVKASYKKSCEEK